MHSVMMHTSHCYGADGGIVQTASLHYSHDPLLRLVSYMSVLGFLNERCTPLSLCSRRSWIFVKGLAAENPGPCSHRQGTIRMSSTWLILPGSQQATCKCLLASQACLYSIFLNMWQSYALVYITTALLIPVSPPTQRFRHAACLCLATCDAIWNILFSLFDFCNWAGTCRRAGWSSKSLSVAQLIQPAMWWTRWKSLLNQARGNQIQILSSDYGSARFCDH